MERGYRHGDIAVTLVASSASGVTDLQPRSDGCRSDSQNVVHVGSACGAPSSTNATSALEALQRESSFGWISQSRFQGAYSLQCFQAKLSQDQRHFLIMRLG